MKTCKLTSALIFLIWLCSSCNNEEKDNVAPPTTPPPVFNLSDAKVLVDTIPVNKLSLTGLKNYLEGGNSLLSLALRNGVSVYKINYNSTDANGDKVLLSGAVVIPDIADSIPLVLYEHATIPENSDENAPSYFPKSGDGIGMALFGANKYLVAAPDYIGYGITKELEHPYQHRQTLASASVDMLLATEEFCKVKRLKMTDKKFITGYSEGAFAGMSTQKLIDEKYPEIKINLVTLGAGAYNTTDFAKFVLTTNANLEFINSYAWVLKVYDKVYKLNRGMEYYFVEPYATELSDNIWASVATNPQALFNQKFVNNILDNSDANFISALKDNDVYNWTPKVQMLLYHGTDDDYVPIFNSESAEAYMKERGANVKLIKISSANHTTAVPTFYINALTEFNAKK